MILAFSSCQKNNSLATTKKTENQLTPQQVKQVALMKEVALATGKAMKSNEVKDYLVELVKVKNDNSEAISLAALLGDNAHTTQYEKTLLNKGFAKDLKSAPVNKSLFANAFLNVISSNPNKYPILTKSLPHLKSSNSIGDELDSLKQVLAKENLEIYLPYRQEFNWNSISQVTVTWAPLTQDTISEGEIMPLNNLKSASAQPVNNIDEKYVVENPTVLVRPIDPTDYTIIENNGGGTGGGTGGFEPTIRWVTTNLDYTKVSEKDVLSVYLPRLRLLKNYRHGWLGGSSQITIYKAWGKIIRDNSGDLIPSADKNRLIYNFKISREDVKDSVWKTVNIFWDDDWDLHENTEQFVLVSRQGIFSGSKLDIKGSVKIGYDFVKMVATANATVSANFEITTERRNILRYNNGLSRRGALANVVGDIGAGTILDNGVHYTIRTADALQYYFKFKWTDVAE